MTREVFIKFDGETEWRKAELREGEAPQVGASPQNDAKDLKDQLFVLLRGPLFPPRSYEQNGEMKTWDDKEFFESMIKRDSFSPKQEALILKRIDYYKKNGSKLKQENPVATGMVAPSLGDVPF